MLEKAVQNYLWTKTTYSFGKINPKKCSILILDEPTSNLDIETERLFYQTLKNINKIKKITIILITHRLDYVKDSDKIIVLNKGIIEAEGSHNNLLQSNNWY